MSAESLDDLVQAANSGCPEYAFLLGFLYERGLLVGQSQDSAQQWYRKAAIAGLAGGAFALARLGELSNASDASGRAMKFALTAAGKGLPAAQLMAAQVLLTKNESDVEEATRWLRQAADAGNSEARAELVRLSAEGEISPVSIAAVEESNDSEALFTLATRFANGDGCDLDVVRAVDYYSRSALGGSRAAALILAMAYSKGGLGLTVDSEKARYYMELANAA